jgi:amino acid transporter
MIVIELNVQRTVFFTRVLNLILVGVSSCILAYSGIESVVQTASLVRSWKEIRKAYTFLTLTVGIFTPLLAAIVLSSTINLSQHETDLITQLAIVCVLKNKFFYVLCFCIERR